MILRNALLLLALPALAGAASAQQNRLWFSLTGVPEGEPIAGTPPEYISNTQGINPVIDAGTGSVRLYVWGTVEAEWRGFYAVGLDINLYPQAGDVTITDSRFYNYFSPYPQTARWGMIDQGVLTPTKLDDVLMQAGGNWWGWSVNPLDQQVDPRTFSMLLGFVDLQMSPEARGGVFFGVGEYGFNTHPFGAAVFFGWGDEPVVQYPWGQQSTLADATIVPEARTSALTLVAGLLLGLRYRRAGLHAPR